MESVSCICPCWSHSLWEAGKSSILLSRWWNLIRWGHLRSIVVVGITITTRRNEWDWSNLILSSWCRLSIAYNSWFGHFLASLESFGGHSFPIAVFAVILRGTNGTTWDCLPTLCWTISCGWYWLLIIYDRSYYLVNLGLFNDRTFKLVTLFWNRAEIILILLLNLL